MENESKGRGRPTKYKKSMNAIAEDFIAKGHSKLALCAELDITEDTLYRWIKENEDFSESIKRGVARGLKFYEQRILGLASGAIDRKVAEKIDKTSLIFILKTRFHKQWGRMDKVEVSNPDGTMKPSVTITIPSNGRENES